MTARNKRWLAVGLILLGFVMIGVGFANGEAAIVLKKAARICLECIGVG